MRAFLYMPLIIGVIVMIVGLLTFKRTEEKELSQMKHVIREASRKNEHLKINYEVKPKNN